MQQVVNILFLGSLYGLFALGFTLVIGVLNILNLAHVATVAIGGLGTYFLIVGLGVPYPLAVAIAILAAALFGVVIYYAAFVPLSFRGGGDSSMSGLVASIAFLTVVQALLLGTVGAQARILSPSDVPRASFEIAGSRFDTMQLGALGVSLAVMFGLLYLMNRTKWGRSIKTIAFDQEAALVTGVNVRRVIITTFLISGALGGIVGSFMTSLYGTAAWNLGQELELKALAIVILGGLGSAKGALIGGFLLAAAEVAATVFLAPGYADSVAFLVIYLLLVFRPQGLFSTKQSRVA